MSETYIPVVGLEVHIELGTKSKLFCACPSDHFGKKPNTQVCPICLGLPGALPFTNKDAVTYVIKFGLAFGCRINLFSKFDRKHYFYPDLPKGYQISQYDLPLCSEGKFETLNPKSEIRIRRVHLEEDTGKLVHETVEGKKSSLIDFNRSSVPLMEIVTEPDFHDIESVISFLKEVQLAARYLGISNADMEKGSMRLEANVSLANSDERIANRLPEYKVELKNINSFKFLEKAVRAELIRQEKVLTEGGKVENETRGYDEVKETTFPQRIKEEANDYRYFPEPDLPPIRISELEIKNLKLKIPELPANRRLRFKKQYNLPDDFIQILIADKSRADYFEEAAKLNNNYKVIADLIINKKMDVQFPEPAGLIKKITELTSATFALTHEVESAVNLVIMDNEKAVNDYREGKGEVVGFLIGAVQKRLQGKGNVNTIRELLLKNLQKNG